MSRTADPRLPPNERARRAWAATSVLVWPERYVGVSFAESDFEIAAALVVRTGGSFAAVVREVGEVSAVLEEEAWTTAPERALARSQNAAWTVLTMDQTLDLDLCGYLAPALVRLAEAEIPVWPAAGHRTDHLLVPARRASEARAILEQLIRECASLPPSEDLWNAAPRGRARLKVCCIASAAEARLALRYGASALGLVSEMPSGPGPIAEDVIAEIAASVPPGASTVLLTAHTEAERIIDQQRRCGVGALQLVDAVAPAELKRLRAALPGIALIQVIHVRSPASVEEACAVAPWVDALLLDSGNPAASVKVLGGTGRVHDWALSRRIRDRAGRPVFLAGGLNPDNAARAIASVEPYGLDVCTGLRTAGVLDEAKLSAFCRAIGLA